mmetsp:Transcript_34462/g.57899  ORF Transcript_34462/g.57899 Transcript_34462/m.57899 type:complete len:215 (-) Transcript_34462:54-698(-)
MALGLAPGRSTRPKVPGSSVSPERSPRTLPAASVTKMHTHPGQCPGVCTNLSVTPPTWSSWSCVTGMSPFLETSVWRTAVFISLLWMYTLSPSSTSSLIPGMRHGCKRWLSGKGKNPPMWSGCACVATAPINRIPCILTITLMPSTSQHGSTTIHSPVARSPIRYMQLSILCAIENNWRSFGLLGSTAMSRPGNNCRKKKVVSSGICASAIEAI